MLFPNVLITTNAYNQGTQAVYVNLLRYLLILFYLGNCLWTRTNPLRYFQLNAPFFNARKRIFSKLDNDALIPIQWRLNQCADDGVRTNFHYPVFVKPEWGQNGYGVMRADDARELNAIRKLVATRNQPYLLQEAAVEPCEFEIYWVLSADDDTEAAVLAVVESTNPVPERYPVNSVRNSNTAYRDRTAELDAEQRAALWTHMRSFGRLAMSRVAVRANSLDDVIAGYFHVIEINLYSPMPLQVLDPDKSTLQLFRSVHTTTRALARIGNRIPPNQARKHIFLRKLLLARRNKLLPLTR